ncbi:hypothetical protein AU194_03735 [Mycobacterium sp. GA-2829]|nr:hypothetical protein AU194_03735 [Mycobacterium sp. GA-2829]
MRLHGAARALIGPGADATLITLNPDGSPQATVVWMAVQRTEDGDDELVTAHLSEHRNPLPACGRAARVPHPDPHRRGRRRRPVDHLSTEPAWRSTGCAIL